MAHETAANVGRFGHHTHIPLQEASIQTTEDVVKAVARVTAQATIADYWVYEIKEWEAQDEWEKEQYAEANYPDMTYEDLDNYMKKSRAAIEAMRLYLKQ